VTSEGLWNIAAADPDRCALVDPAGLETTYRDLAATADRYGRGLQAMGLRPGDSIVLMLPNSSELVAVYFAAMQTGLYVVMVNWHLVGPEVAYLVGDSGAKAFIAHERFAAVAVDAAARADLPPEAHFAVGDVPGFQPLSRLGEGEPATRPDVRTAGSPMLYTSGTTGRPKGVRRPLTGADPDVVPPSAAWFFGIFGIKPFDAHVHLCGSPLYHTAVLNFVVISIQLGHTAVLMDHWDPEEMLRLIERHRVTHSHMVPTQFHRLLALPDDTRSRYDLSSLRTMIHGAAPCPIEVKRRMLDWWGPVVIEYYAATEGGGTAIGAEEWLRKPGSVGLPWPSSVVQIFDENGAELPAGQQGLVYMRMGTATFEYHKDEEKTRTARLGDLFTLGDIGYLDEDGYLFLCDRKSDLIISGGVNIYPAEIEGELACHPKVADVAVFGVPHADWGEEIKAVVQPVEPGAEFTEELLAFAAERLAKFKLPRTVDYVVELPRDPNGKLYKRKLRDPYWKKSRGRDRVKMSKAEVDDFLLEQRTLVVASIGKSGVPHLAPMWFAVLDGEIVFCTDRHSQKIVNLRREPRMSALVETGETYGELRGVFLEGVAEVSDDPADLARVVDAVVARYVGPLDDDESREGLRRAMAKRVAVVFRPSRVSSWDHRKVSTAPDEPR
jgi:long-chain acyl-CoA synthetase